MSFFNQNISFSYITGNNFSKKLIRFLLLESIVSKYLCQGDSCFNGVWFKESPMSVFIYIEFFEEENIRVNQLDKQQNFLFFQKHAGYLFNYQKPVVFLYSNLILPRTFRIIVSGEFQNNHLLASIISAAQRGFYVAEAFVRCFAQIIEKTLRVVSFLDSLFILLNDILFKGKVQGFRFRYSGRIGGVDRSKVIIFQKKQLSFKKFVDFQKINSAFYPVKTAYGVCGIFFWIVFKLIV